MCCPRNKRAECTTTSWCTVKEPLRPSADATTRSTPRRSAALKRCCSTLGPLAAAFVLASHLPKERIYALLAACPAVVTLSVLAIATVVRANEKRTGGREWVSNPPGTG